MAAVSGTHTITSRQLAARWGVGESSVKRRVASGEWPSFRVGRRRLIPLAWVKNEERCAPLRADSVEVRSGAAT